MSGKFSHNFKLARRQILTTAEDIISCANLPYMRRIMVVANLIPVGTPNLVIRFNNDSGANYAERKSTNGGADTTAGSATLLNPQTNSANLLFVVFFITNMRDGEKLVIYHCNTAASGAATAPSRTEMVGKWSNVTDVINRIDIINTNAGGDFAIGSQVKVYGFGFPTI